MYTVCTRLCTQKNLTDSSNLITPSIFRVCCLAVFEFFTHCNLGASDLRGMVVFICFVLCVMKHLLDQAFHTSTGKYSQVLTFIFSSLIGGSFIFKLF